MNTINIFANLTSTFLSSSLYCFSCFFKSKIISLTPPPHPPPLVKSLKYVPDLTCFSYSLSRMGDNSRWIPPKRRLWPTLQTKTGNLASGGWHLLPGDLSGGCWLPDTAQHAMCWWCWKDVLQWGFRRSPGLQKGWPMVPGTATSFGLLPYISLVLWLF